MLLILSGLAAGAAHVVTGPDHLAAVAPLAVEDPAAATRAGFRWGLGHGLGAVVMALIGLAIKDFVHLEALSAWAEFGVGFVLVGVGLWAFVKAQQIVVHVHEHTHEGEQDLHRHVHVHAEDHAPEASAPGHEGHTHAAMAVGALHGMAGTGHLLAVVPAMALSVPDALVYLSAYLVAAVGAMTGAAFLLGRLTANAGSLGMKRVMYASSFAAVLCGVVWVGSTWPGA